MHEKARFNAEHRQTILLIHGWPGSIFDYYNLIGPLITPAGHPDEEDHFDVVVPCLPGFGWSDGATEMGMGPVEIAIVLRNLMIKLGYTKFHVHGGGWGGVIASHIATLFPQNVIGLHLSTCNVYNKYSNWLGWIDAFVRNVRSFQPRKTLLTKRDRFFAPIYRPDTLGIHLFYNLFNLPEKLHHLIIINFLSRNFQVQYYIIIQLD